MNLRAETTVDKPRKDVFEAYRDHLVELVPELPSVRAIEMKSREEKGGKLEVVSVWHGGADIPAAVRAFLSESMLSWTDNAVWDPASFTCAWRSDSHSFREAVDSSGVNYFEEVGPGRTRIRIEGNIRVDATKIPAVPRLLAGTAGGLVERFLIKQVQDNMQEVARAVERFLDRRG
ncbi:MAG TPA: hypothetical protein VKY51_08665 [Fredinandcohnia sp.]|nr:hypothetical protein [Fredinandcohnia sp.]